VYAADGRKAARRLSAIEIIESAALLDCVLLSQALSEFFHVVVRKRILPGREAMAKVKDWLGIFLLATGPGESALSAAMEAATAGRFQFFDALFLATAQEAGCAAVLSEDVADNAEMNGLQVIPAFTPAGAISDPARVLLGLKS
jgi:predicted nucleic acid-binding protein